MLFAHEVTLRPRADVQSGRLIIAADLNGGASAIGISVQHEQGGVYFSLRDVYVLRTINQYLPHVLDLGTPVVRFNPLDVVIHEEMLPGALYLPEPETGPALYLPGKNFLEGGEFVGLNGHIRKTRDARMVLGIENWEIGIERDGEFVGVIKMTAKKPTA